MIDKDQVRELVGRELRTTDGTKIGKIGHVYVDDYRDAPEWVPVKTGPFGSSESFVPVEESVGKERIELENDVDAAGRLRR